MTLPIICCILRGWKKGKNMKDKRTNKNYNPTIEFNKAINSDWFKEIVTRMGKEENIKKAL